MASVLSPDQLAALQAALKLVVDAGKDAYGVSKGASVVTFVGLVPEILALIPDLSGLPTDVAAMAPADYLTLSAALVADLGISDVHAQAVVAAGLDLLNELVSGAMPKIEALVAAIKAP